MSPAAGLIVACAAAVAGAVPVAMHPAVVATAVPHVQRGAASATPTLAAYFPAAVRQRLPGGDSATGRVVADTFRSQALGTRKRALVWLPPSYAGSPARRYPVLYYLHGAFGSENDWTKRGRLDRTLDSLTAAGLPELIVVMPDGDDGWYTTWNYLGDNAACRRAHAQQGEPADTYCVPWPHYDDYVARDLVAHVDSAYRTLADRSHRGIAGLSMGGYGAVSLALAYPDVFSAAASHSGTLAPMVADSTGRYAGAIDSLRTRYSPSLWALIVPAFGRDTAAWLARDPARLAARLDRARPALRPRLFVDCGVEDSFLAQNRAFRSAMISRKWPLVYHEWPGAHDWDYWRRHAVESVRWLAQQVAS